MAAQIPALEPRSRTQERTRAARADSNGATTAQTLIAEWVDHCRKRPPGAVVGQVARHVKAMLAEGIDPAHVRAGLTAWQHKGLHPAVLPSVVNEVMNAAPGKSTRQQATDALFERAAHRMGITR